MRPDAKLDTSTHDPCASSALGDRRLDCNWIDHVASRTDDLDAALA
jgi:hypothetical protein